MILSKKLFLASASVLVLGIGTAPSAQAFDDVNWSWDKQVTSVENITINVDDTFDISGLVEVEKIQMNIGDVTATSTVSGIDNNPPGSTEGGTVIINEVFNFNTTYDDEADPDGIDPAGPVAGNVLDGEIVGGAVDEGSDEIDITFAVTGTVDLESVEGINDAVDLPSVESTATAVGNNQSISSTVAVNLHDGQYNMGDIGLGDRQIPLPGVPVATDVETASLFEDEGGNTHTDILAIGALGAALGIIQQVKLVLHQLFQTS